MIHRVHGIFGADPIPQYRCMIRQPGLTHRSTCPSIPGLGAGGTPPKIDASMDWICLRTSSYLQPSPAISRDSRTILQSRRNITSTVERLFPKTPSPSNKFHRWRGIWGEVKKYILFCFVVGEVPFPSNASMCFIPVALDWGCPHPSIHLSSSIPTQPFGCVVHLIIIIFYSY